MRYEYLPEILGKLMLSFERYGEAYTDLQPIEQQVRGLLEKTGPDNLVYDPCLRSLMRILRTAKLHSWCGQLIYLRVLGDVANAQGKSIPKHPGEHYLDVLP